MMLNTYANCPKLTTAVCGDSVTRLDGAYWKCINLITPACGPNVEDMSMAYQNCTNLTSAVCGEKVQDFAAAYANCSKLTRAVFGPNVTSISSSYYNCRGIQGNTYISSNNVYTVASCFYNRHTGNMLNIYVHDNSKTLTSLLISNIYSLVGRTMNWRNDITNKCYYDSGYNIYIYSVANVEEARIANGDPDYMGNL